MEERARLVKGHVTIHSKPQQGTTIAVRVPVDGADDLQEQPGFLHSAEDQNCS
jgi:hypothetical protein